MLKNIHACNGESNFAANMNFKLDPSIAKGYLRKDKDRFLVSAETMVDISQEMKRGDDTSFWITLEKAVQQLKDKGQLKIV
jgi:hypothetical protein